MKELILASASPRRKELMSLAGWEYRVCPADVDERLPQGLPVEQSAEFLAKIKGQAVQADHPHAVVISADTIVVSQGEILGKPVDEADARRMLRALSGKTHEVHTGVAVFFPDKAPVTFTERTRVTFYPLTDEEIDAYVATREPMDKAGSYGIQGKGCVLVKEIAGDYYNVVGLPIARLTRLLKKEGLR